MVTFSWRDYRDGKKKNLIVTTEEFIRRFMLHILPSGFRKIRHYGILASRDKSKRISLCRRLTQTPVKCVHPHPRPKGCVACSAIISTSVLTVALVILLEPPQARLQHNPAQSPFYWGGGSYVIRQNCYCPPNDHPRSFPAFSRSYIFFE